MSDDNNKMAEFVSDNPRKIGVLFTLLLALSQAGSVAATTTATTIV